MALKNVTSNDDRKPAAVAALKAASGKRSVTMLKHDTVRNTYVGHCFNRASSGFMGKHAQDQVSYFYAVRVDTGELVGYWDSMAEYQADEGEGATFPHVVGPAYTPVENADLFVPEHITEDNAPTQGTQLNGTEAPGPAATPEQVDAANAERGYGPAEAAADEDAGLNDLGEEAQARGVARDMVMKAKEHRLDMQFITTGSQDWGYAYHVAHELQQLGTLVDGPKAADDGHGYQVTATWPMRPEDHDEAQARRELVARGQARTCASQAATCTSKSCTKAFLTRAHAEAVATELRRLGMHASVESRTAQGAPLGTHGWYVDAVWPEASVRGDSCERCGDDASTLVVRDARRTELAQELRKHATFRAEFTLQQFQDAANALEAPTERELELDAIVHGEDLAKVLGFAEGHATNQHSLAMLDLVVGIRDAINRDRS